MQYGVEDCSLRLPIADQPLGLRWLDTAFTLYPTANHSPHNPSPENTAHPKPSAKLRTTRVKPRQATKLSQASALHTMKRLIIPLTSCLLTLTSLGAAKPNILMIIVDDLKPNLGCYGNDLAKTPNIDKIAQAGVVFTNAHANQAVCGPSRCSFFTSLRPDRTKVHDLKTNFLGVTPWVVSMPEQFRKHGYATAGCGKLFHGGRGDKVMDQRAWGIHTEKDALPYNKDYPHPAMHYQNKKTQQTYQELKKQGITGYGKVVAALKKKHYPSTECLDVPDDAYIDGASRIQAIRNIEKLSSGNKPFFVAVGFSKPHLPFVAPKKYWDLYKREEMPLAKYQKPAVGAPSYALHSWGELKAYSDISSDGPVPTTKQRELIHGYYAATSYTDAQIGLLLDELKKKDLLKNTIVILWGDHGWHLGDHGVWCKHTNYEQSTHSPLIISGPGIKHGLKTDAPTELIDIFPTLCELTGVPMVKNADGLSFKTLLEGSTQPIREVAISSYPRYGGRMGYALRNNKFRYVAWVNNPNYKTKPLSELKEQVILAEELYDYSTDPLETKSLAKNPEKQAVIKKFRAQLNQHLKSQAQRIFNQ